MNTAQLITLAASLCTVITLAGTIIAKLMQGHTSKIVGELIKDYLSELKPNHGSSLRDDINLIKKEVGELKVDVATLEGKFSQHIEEGNR